MEELLQKSISNVQNAFTGPKNTQELIAQVQKVMPMNPLHYEILCVKGQTSAFSAKIDVRLKSEEHINAFINGYGSRNNETLRISKTKRIFQLGKILFNLLSISDAITILDMRLLVLPLIY